MWKYWDFYDFVLNCGWIFCEGIGCGDSITEILDIQVYHCFSCSANHLKIIVTEKWSSPMTQSPKKSSVEDGLFGTGKSSKRPRLNSSTDISSLYDDIDLNFILFSVYGEGFGSGVSLLLNHYRNTIILRKVPFCGISHSNLDIQKQCRTAKLHKFNTSKGLSVKILKEYFSLLHDIGKFFLIFHHEKSWTNYHIQGNSVQVRKFAIPILYNLYDSTFNRNLHFY